MTKKVDTWMPLLIDKYLGDTTHLTTELHGAYLLLLMSMWKRGGFLPNDDAQLQPITRLPPAKWRASRAVLMAFFHPDDGGNLRQKRLELELVNANKRSDAKAEAGSKGAAKRWRTDSTANGTGNGKQDGTAIAERKQTASQTGASISIPVPKHPSDASVLLPGTSGEVPPPRPGADGPQLTLVEPTQAKPYEPPDCPHQRVLALWAEALPTMPQHKPEQWKGARADHLRVRWRETAVSKGWTNQDEGIEWMRRFFEYIGKSAFLTGQRPPMNPGGRPFVIKLEWLAYPGNWAKVIEGEYHREAA